MPIVLAIGVIWLYFECMSPSVDPEELPKNLHPKVGEQAGSLVRIAGERGIQVLITDGFRSFEEQDDLYAKGRDASGNIVTHAKAGESYHNYGLAIDFALLMDNGEATWDMSFDGNGNGNPDWQEVVAIAKELGFEWGGDWENFKDYPHLQMDFGLSIRELQRGKLPAVQDSAANK